MSWLYSRALVEAYSADICSDGAQSAPSSGNHTPQAYLSQDKMKAFSRLSRSGMTCKLLTDGHGEALLTSYLVGSHAKTSQSPEKAQASTASDRACGGTWHESSMKYDRDSHSWKTHRHLFDEVLPESSVILPKSGMTVDGVLWELMTSARRTEEKESGYWLAPTAMQTNETPGTFQARMEKYQNGTKVANLTMQVKNQKFWPTPMKSDGSISGTTAQQSRETPQLAAAVKIWPTPDTCGGGSGPSQANRNQPRLQDAVKLFPTPSASDNRDRGNIGSPATLRRKEKGKQIMLSQSVSTESGALNPDWVEWLMGWPIGWTDLKPLGMARFQRQQQQHSDI